MAVQLETREIQVERTNDHGFKSTAGEWFNPSKYASPADVVMPTIGQRVTVHLDRSGFVRKVEALPAPATSAPASVRPETPTGPIATPTIAQDDRSILTTRLATLAAAVAILTTGGGATTDEDVLILAERLERWATR